MTKTVGIFTTYREAANFARLNSMKYSVSYIIRDTGNGWGVYKESPISSAQERPNEKLNKKSRPVWSDGRPLEPTQSPTPMWKLRPGAAGKKYNVDAGERGQPGDHRPDGKAACFICGGRGTGQGGRACSHCHGYGYLRK